MKKLIIGAFTAAIIAGSAASTQAQTIGVALASDTNPFYIAMLKGMRIEAGKLGYKISVVTANSDVAKQLDGVNDLIAKKVDAILISPIDAKALCSAFNKAKSAGVPMMSIARGSACKSQLLHVAMDEKKIGREIAEWTAKKIGGKGKVAMIAGPAGAATFRNLAEGYESVMAKHSGIKIVYKHNVLLTRENGLKQGEDILVAHPDIAAIYGANDELALGAMQAAKAAGKNKSVVITGMNGVPPAVRAVARGNLDMTVALNPVAWGMLGIKTAKRVMAGDMPKHGVYLNHLLVDSTNGAGLWEKMKARRKKK
jgi:ribose transport system substrate-binding protein